MNDRFKFRATFSVSYYDKNGNDKDIKLTIYDVAVYSGGEIGFSVQQMETIIDALKLPEIEKDSIWQFINDNYATSSYEWFVCDNAIIEQCTGLSDKNRNLIYEGDIVRFVKQRGYYTQKGAIYTIEFGVFRFCGFGWRNRPKYDVEFALTESAAKKCEIIGNIHKTKDDK